MNPQQLAGLIGFLFVAAWIAFGFGDAILCLLGAARVLRRDRLLPRRARPRPPPTTRLSVPNDPSASLNGRSTAMTKRGNEMSSPTASDGGPRAADSTPPRRD